MSSDSDDSYTNSVSVLKALTRKQDISLDSDVTTPKRNHVNFFDTSISPKIDLPELDLSENNDANDSCVLISDSEVDLTPVNIISAIDNVLNQNSKRMLRSSRGKRKATKAIGAPPKPPKRQSKRIKKNNVQNIPMSPHSDVCIVDDDLDEVNFEVIVKVYWKSLYLEKFKIKRFDKIINIYKHFAEKENVPENRLLFTIKNEIISKNDTPESLNITAATIIEGGVLSDNITDKKENGIEFKIQMNDRKQPLLITMNPADKMEILMVKCAEELQIAVNKLKFYFDGELIKLNDTPECLDLEGGEIIDCVKT